MNPWENKTVIIVDDMEHVRSNLDAMYQGLGLNVVGLAKDGIEALDLIKKMEPDLVSLDVIMPEMDGMECYKRICDLKNKPKVLFITYLANEPKFIDAYRQAIPEELFMPKGCSETVFRSRLNFIFGDGRLLNEDPSLKEPLRINPASQQSSYAADPSLDFE